MSWVAVGVGVASLAYGVYQTVDANKQRKKLGEYDEYESPDKLLSKAKANSTGYTAAEKVAFFQSLVRNNNAQYMNAIKYRPDMASTIQAGIDYGNIDALNKFAVNDAEMKRRDEQRLLNLYQGQDARNVQAENTRLYALEQSLGRQQQAGIQNMFSGASTAAGGVSSYYGGETGSKGLSDDGNKTIVNGGSTPTKSNIGMGDTATYLNNHPSVGYTPSVTSDIDAKGQNLSPELYNYGYGDYYNPSYDNIANEYFRVKRKKSYNQ